MTNPTRYAVPLDVIDRVRVTPAQQVEEQRAASQPSDAASWGGTLGPAYGDGAAGGCDADCD